MHGKVQGDGDPRDSGQTDQLGVAQQGGSAMVVGVEEGERLLLEEQEDRVEQFQVFGQVGELFSVSFSIRDLQRPDQPTGCPYIVQNNQLPGPATLMVTDSKENTMSPNSGQ